MFKTGEFLFKLKSLFIIIPLLVIFYEIPFFLLQIKYIFVIYIIYLFGVFYSCVVFLQFCIFFLELSYCHIFIIFSCVMFFNKNFKIKIYYIMVHSLILLFMFSLINESHAYSFITIQQNVIIFKLNSFSSSISLFHFQAFEGINFFKLKLYNFINSECTLNKSNQNYINVFEKVIIFNGGCILEMHSLTFLDFLTTNTFIIIFLLAFLLFVITIPTIYVFFKKIYIFI